MKNFKRKLAGFLVFAMVLGIMAPGVVAQAAPRDGDGPSVTVCYSEETLDFTLGTASAVQFTDKVNTSDPSKTVWEDVDDSLRADISWVKKNKETTLYYRFLDNKEKPVSEGSVTLKAQSADKYKVALITTATGTGIGKDKITVNDEEAVGSADTGWLVVYNSSKNNTVVSPATISFRKGTSGHWLPMTDLEEVLPTLKAKGATLYFQVGRVDGEEPTAWLPKEVKFSYKKQANAPKVKLDLKKDTIAIKAGMEYRANDNDDWTRVTDTKVKSLSIADVLTGSSVTLENVYDGNTATVQVRTVKEGAVPSKTAKVKIKASTMGAINPASNVGITYNVDKGQYEFTNKDDVPYEYTVVTSGTAITFDAKQKWNAIKVPKQGNEAKPVTSLKDTKIDTSKEIIVVRKAAQKAAKAKGTTPAKEELIASRYEIVDMAAKKTESARVISNASVKANVENASFSAVVTNGKLKITGEAASGQAVDVEVTVDVTNTAKDTAVKVDKKVGDATIKAETKVATDGKVKFTISLPKDKACTGKVKLTVGKSEFEFEVAITAAK